MSDSKYKEKRRMNRETAIDRRDRNRHWRRMDKQRICLGIDPPRHRGTQGWLTW